MKKTVTQTQKKSTQEQPDIASLDLDPNAWGKFESLVKSAAKMGHKPHAQKIAKAPKAKGVKS